MIRITEVMPKAQSTHKLVFPDSALAHQYCVGNGIEIGASAHNPFNLPGCLNVADTGSMEFYNANQVEICGSYAEIDLFADAADLPVEDGSQDYVISSHMIEHHVNPLACLVEWARVVRDQGVVFIIFPKRNALPSDATRSVSDVADILDAYTANAVSVKDEGHVFVYTLASMQALVAEFNLVIAPETHRSLHVLHAQETDDKVGNGHLMVLKVVASIITSPEETSFDEPGLVEVLPVAKSPKSKAKT